MAISYPLTMPTVTGIATIEMRAINAVAYSRSPFTFSGQVHAYAGQMWQADVSLPPMRRGDAEVWLSWLVSLKGQLGTFKLGDPLGCMPRGSARDADTILVDGTVTSGGSIAIDSAPANQTNYLLAGDYMQIGAGVNQQLFKVLQNVSTDGSGTATVDVWPNVRSSIANATSVKVQDTTGLFRLSSNEQSWSANQAIYGITFGASEAL
tara:strand:+ start:165 stop:788 length:624 start_codon:yes stop_codon:yes gene_type:complete